MNNTRYSHDVNVDPCIACLSHEIPRTHWGRLKETTDEAWQGMKCLSNILHLESVRQHMPDTVHL